MSPTSPLTQQATSVDAILVAGAGSLEYTTRIRRVGTQGLWGASTTARLPGWWLELLDPMVYDAATIDAATELGLPHQPAGTIAEASVYFADTADAVFDADVAEWFADVCSPESSSLEAAAVRLSQLSAAELDEIGELSVSRLAILDAVAVVDNARGLGVGRRIAAECLYAAGAWAHLTLVLAIAGAQVDRRDVAAYHAVKRRAAHLLDAVGLTEYHGNAGSVFVGHCAYARPATVILDIVHGR